MIRFFFFFFVFFTLKKNPECSCNYAKLNGILLNAIYSSLQQQQRQQVDYNLALSLDLYPAISWGPDENFMSIRAAFGGLERDQIRLGKNQREGASFHFYVKAINSVKQQRNRRKREKEG